MARRWKTLVLALFAALSLGAAALSEDAPPVDVGESDPRVALCMTRLATAHAQGKATPELPTSQAGTDAKPVHPEEITSAVTPPKIIHRVLPQYSEELRKANVAGRVVVEALIDEQGCIVNARALESPDPRFSTLMVDNLARWVFQPAMREGRPIVVYYTVTTNFKVEHDSPRR